jgi:hypothetical protein
MQVGFLSSGRNECICCVRYGKCGEGIWVKRKVGQDSLRARSEEIVFADCLFMEIMDHPFNVRADNQISQLAIADKSKKMRVKCAGDVHMTDGDFSGNRRRRCLRS